MEYYREKRGGKGHASPKLGYPLAPQHALFSLTPRPIPLTTTGRAQAFTGRPSSPNNHTHTIRWSCSERRKRQSENSYDTVSSPAQALTRITNNKCSCGWVGGIHTQGQRNKPTTPRHRKRPSGLAASITSATALPLQRDEAPRGPKRGTRRATKEQDSQQQ